MLNDRVLIFIVILASAAAGCGLDAPSGTAHNGAHDSLRQLSPYAGEESRAIKSLSQEEVDGLLAGEGLGYAMAAELNGYPGPRHVLDLADQLELTEELRATVEAEFARMQSEAQDAGRRFVAIEARLDSLFQHAGAAERVVAELARESARAEADVRAAHLASHVRTASYLTPKQIQEYVRLRGYGGEAPHEHAAH